MDNNYGNQISLSLKNIEKSLKEISDCYIFFKKSYNAYKHGYRLWVGKEHDTEAAIFRNKNGSEKKSSSIFFENNNEYTEALVEVAKPFLDILSNQLVDNIMMAATTVNIN